MPVCHCSDFLLLSYCYIKLKLEGEEKNCISFKMILFLFFICSLWNYFMKHEQFMWVIWKMRFFQLLLRNFFFFHDCCYFSKQIKTVLQRVELHDFLGFIGFFFCVSWFKRGIAKNDGLYLLSNWVNDFFSVISFDWWEHVMIGKFY